MQFRFDAQRYPYPSCRRVIFGRRGMVCASQPLAAQAGLDILRRGGNAVDAAVATAACMTVLEPVSNGLGGDSFALVWTKGRLYGLNGSGPAPMAADPQALRDAGHTAMPLTGWAPVTVPGAPGAWAALSQRFGRLPFAELLEPAVSYAREGYPVSPVISALWEEAIPFYRAQLPAELFEIWQRLFAPEGRAPAPGELWRLPEHAATLEELARTGAQSLYQGPLAAAVDAHARATGGALRREDLAAYRPEWVEPVSVNYRGYDVWELPPNGHGIVALMALNILEGFRLDSFGTPETVHRQLESIKLAFGDGLRYIADPRFMQVDVGRLLSKDYAARRRAQIGARALEPAPGDPNSGGTVYLCAADGEGNMVSYIQSNYNGFGSGVVVPGTGIALHNRGSGFSLDPASENCLAPGKKPYHTIIPGFLSQGGEAVGPFGVMGAFMQPQGHLQVVSNLVDFGMNPQQALDAPRWQWLCGRQIELEQGFSGDLARELLRRGHQVSLPVEDTRFGRGQIIWRGENGVLCGGTEPRTDGAVAAF